MLRYVTQYVTLLLRRHKVRLFAVYTIVAICVLKIIGNASSQQPERYYDITNKDREALERGVKETLNRHPSLRKHLTNLGIVDTARTVALRAETAKRLDKQTHWLRGECGFAQPISHGLFGVGETAEVSEYLREIHLKRAVLSIAHKHYARDIATRESITLLTQLSADRFDLLGLLSAQWSGPMNVAIYTPFNQLQYLNNQVSAWLEKEQRSNIMVHLVQRTGRLYPVNWLRNLVIKNASSEYILMIDADFLPSKTLMRKLLQEFKEMKNKKKDDKHAIIVPAFEFFDQAPNFPNSKRSVLSLIRRGKVDVFHRRKHPEGHRIWLFDKWRESEKSYLLPKEEICSEPEPYIAVKKSRSPFFPETLLERGKNKVAYHFEMCLKDFRFIVLSEGHLVHKPHPESAKANARVDRCVYEAWDVYRSGLAKMADKAHLYESHIPDTVFNILYIFLCVIYEMLWFLLLESPLIVVMVTRKLRVFRQSHLDHRPHQV